MGVQIHPLALLGSVLVWIATYLCVCWLLVMAHRRSLVCWSIGLFGVAAVYLRAPSRALVAAQVFVPALLMAGTGYACLYLTHPMPLGGLDQRLTARLALAALIFLVIALVEGARIVGDLRFPLWGEARVLACVQRFHALGGLIHFTPSGRRFLRERFGATPREFVRAVG